MKNFVAIVLAVAVIACCLIIERGYTYKYKTRHTISVAGSAYHNFTADLIVWSASFERTLPDLKDAYSQLKADEQQVRTYLTAHGLADSEAVFSSIDIEKIYEEETVRFSNAKAHPVVMDDEPGSGGKETRRVFKGYKLKQTVKVESKAIDRVERISREITELLQGGVELNSEEPLYYYTKLADLKISLLSQASADAYNRAQTIAKNAHGSLGKLKEANMGVFQITGQYSNENFTYSGAYNTSSKNKTANVIVRMEYELQ